MSDFYKYCYDNKSLAVLESELIQPANKFELTRYKLTPGEHHDILVAALRQKLREFYNCKEEVIRWTQF